MVKTKEGDRVETNPQLVVKGVGWVAVGGGGGLVGNDVIYRIPHGEDKGGGEGGDKSSVGC